jgi:capsular polysaccharide biosynthesis protein
MTSMEKPPQDPELSEQLARVRAFLKRASRFWPSVLLTLALGGLAFGIFSHFRQPKYRSETVILYVERRSTDDQARVENSQQAVAVRLKELLFARPNLERVVTKFGLYPETRASYGMVDAIEELKKDIEFRAPGGDTFSIAFDGTSPSQAQRVTAELARMVIEGDSELRKSQARVALDFLAGERKTRETALREAEEQLASFMAQHPRFALDATPLADGAAIRASMGAVAAPAPGRQSWPMMARQAGPVGAKSTAPLSAPGVAPPSAATSNAEEARARAAIAAANEDLAEKLARYTPAHPDVKAAEAAVQRANERLAALAGAPAPKPAVAAEPAAEPGPVASAAPAPRSPAPIALAPRATAPAPVPAASAARGRNQGLVEMETQWLKLTRAVTEARQRQDQIEAQLFRADIQVSSESGGHGAQVNVIDPAFMPQRPLPPGRTTIAVLFLAGSLLIGMLVALLRAAFDERVLAASDVAGLGEVLAEIPRVMKRRSHAAT